MKEEQMKILKMIEDGVITAADGMKLLEAISDEPEVNESAKNESVEWVRIKVSDPKRVNKDVNIKLPMSLIKIGMKIGEKFSGNFGTNLDPGDFQKILEAIKEGGAGEVINIETDDGQIVEISLV
ncbi:MAG: hypothetical protein K8R73_11510 [Clostridiales bacterium]|nr:hypothetical protein [Clostridiales bacterium]